MVSLVGKTAIVTGASAGLGAAVAQELAARGARVLMCSRDETRLNLAAKKTTNLLTEQGPYEGVRKWYTPLTLAGDITNPATSVQLAEEAQLSFGGLDIVVCNAGGPPPGDFCDCSDETWLSAFNLILLGTIRTIRSCLPLLRAGTSGRIVSIASISGFQPVPHLVLSNTLRPALMGLIKHLSVELAGDGILINAVAPGFFDTERSQEVLQAIAAADNIKLSEVQERITDQIPLRRQGTPPELGHFVSYLVSEENSYITGQTIPIDGGWLVS